MNLVICYELAKAKFCLPIALATELTIEAGLKFAKVYFTNFILACSSSKIFSCQSFPLCNVLLHIDGVINEFFVAGRMA